MTRIKILILMATLGVVLGGCELFGLKVQEDYNYKVHVLDPHIDKNVYDFIMSNPDNAFDSLISAIKYAGLTADDYNKPGQTYFLLHDLAIYRTLAVGGAIDPLCYFGKKLVNGKPAKKWKDYPVEQVRQLLLYHIVAGEYSFDNLIPDNTTVTSLASGDKNSMLLRVINDRDSKLSINDFFGSLKIVQARTSNIQTTNGPAHILGDYAEYTTQ